MLEESNDQLLPVLGVDARDEGDVAKADTFVEADEAPMFVELVVEFSGTVFKPVIVEFAASVGNGSGWTLPFRNEPSCPTQWQGIISTIIRRHAVRNHVGCARRLGARRDCLPSWTVGTVLTDIAESPVVIIAYNCTPCCLKYSSAGRGSQHLRPVLGLC